MAFEWTGDLVTGSSVIDGEHKELFDAANKLIDACSKGQGRAMIESTSKFLLDYVNKHFSHEEDLMRKNNYPDFTAHKSFHTEYARRLRDIVRAIPVSNPTITDLGNLNKHIVELVSHIRTGDKSLGVFLSGKEGIQR